VILRVMLSFWLVVPADAWAIGFGAAVHHDVDAKKDEGSPSFASHVDSGLAPRDERPRVLVLSMVGLSVLRSSLER
jgi:hypothetical protein